MRSQHYEVVTCNSGYAMSVLDVSISILVTKRAASCVFPLCKSKWNSSGCKFLYNHYYSKIAVSLEIY